MFLEFFYVIILITYEYKSYDEILKVLKLNGREDLAEIVYKGSETYLVDEHTPVESPAADFMAELAKSYSLEKPLYIIL